MSLEGFPSTDTRPMTSPPPSRSSGISTRRHCSGMMITAQSSIAGWDEWYGMKNSSSASPGRRHDCTSAAVATRRVPAKPTPCSAWMRSSASTLSRDWPIHREPIESWLTSCISAPSSSSPTGSEAKPIRSASSRAVSAAAAAGSGIGRRHISSRRVRARRPSISERASAASPTSRRTAGVTISSSHSTTCPAQSRPPRDR